ncbi:MAG: ribosome maturation factor RimP [Oscillospiraceae bacterium]
MALAKGFSAVEAAAEAAVRPIVESHGFTLWDVWFVKEGAKWYLRIFIDKPEGISIDDCESIDGLINAEIDKQDFIDRIDYLEVGSAGLERSVRRLAQLPLAVGKRIKVKTYKLCEGMPSKAFSCTLSDFDGEKITVTGDFGEASLPVAEVSAINYDDFDDHDLLNSGE